MENPDDLVKLAAKINEALETYSDKDWNYSRISLCIKNLELLDSPYALWSEFIDAKSDDGKADLKSLSGEIKWGTRHSDELGILELISLRLNKALLESTSDVHWNHRRPVIRVVPKQTLVDQGYPSAFWYEVTEVAGEEFDSR